MRPGIVLHQEEPRDHCNSVRSDNHFEDFIPVPNSSQGTLLATTWRFVRPFKDRPPQTITDSSLNRWCWMMFQAASHSPRRHQAILRPSPVLSVNLLSSVKRTGRQCRTWQFQCSLAMPIKRHSAGLWAQVPLEDVGPSRHPHGVCFWTGWSETCTPVACWRLFCRAPAVLLLFLLAQRSRYRSCWWVDALLRPRPALLV